MSPARRPLLVVVGNCQAESLRLLLDAGDVRSVRVPPVHEMTAADLRPLSALLRRTDLLVTQPVADDYRGLPVGTAQLRRRLPAHARAVVVPSVRYAGLHPLHVLVHPPGLDRPDPPVVPYHDVRTVIVAAGGQVPAGWSPDPAAVRAIASASVAELERREARHDAVVVSDLLVSPVADSMRTINHPGNAVLEPLAARVRVALGLSPRPPGVRRPLLTSVHAPLLPSVVAAHDLDVPPTEAWTVDGRTVTTAEVEHAHRAWYAERPGMLEAALERALPVVGLLGLPRPELP